MEVFSVFPPSGDGSYSFVGRVKSSVLQVLRARIMARQIRVEYATVTYPPRRGATSAWRFIAMMRTGSGIPGVIHRLQEKTKRRSSTGTAFEDPCRQSVTNQPLIPSLDQQASG